jgi:hypothetical protein
MVYELLSFEEKKIFDLGRLPDFCAWGTLQGSKIFFYRQLEFFIFFSIHTLSITGLSYFLNKNGNYILCFTVEHMNFMRLL